MNKQGSLNAKIKFLIILAYTIILFLIIFLIFGTTKASQFEDYGDKPYDENIALNMQITEERKSLYETYNASNERSKEKKLGLNEKSIYKFQLVAIKLNTKYISNIYVNVAAKTADNRYKYASYSGSRSMSSGVFTTTFSFANFSTKEVIEKEVGSGSKMKTFDETPKEVYIEVKYKVGSGSSAEEKVLKYSFNMLEVSNKKFNKYQTRDILDANATENKNYINPSDDVLGIRIRKTEVGTNSTISEIKKDAYKIQVIDIVKNIDKFTINQDNVTENSYVAIEQSNANKNPVRPEINNMKLEIWGKVESKDKKFSNYVKMYSLYGFMSKYRELTEYAAAIDESFNLSEIYVVAEGSIYNGTTDSFKIAYQVNFHNLPVIPENE